MAMHLERAVDLLKKRLLLLGARVEEAVREAARSVERRDAFLAQRVIDGDNQIDDIEVDIEEECLKILALYQPVAVDLRFIITVLKINDSLERIGDVAVNIAGRSAFLAGQKQPDVYFEFPAMAQKAQSMLSRSLDALVRLDARLAREVCVADDEVDAMNHEMYELTKTRVQSHPGEVESLLHFLAVSRHLERVADLAVSIAEDVIYLVEGEIVRHRTESFKAQLTNERQF